MKWEQNTLVRFFFPSTVTCSISFIVSHDYHNLNWIIVEVSFCFFWTIWMIHNPTIAIFCMIVVKYITQILQKQWKELFPSVILKKLFLIVSDRFVFLILWQVYGFWDTNLMVCFGTFVFFRSFEITICFFYSFNENRIGF